MFLQMNRIHPGIALGHRRTLPAAQRHDMLHGHALIHQSSGVGMADLVGMEVVGADLLCRRDQGLLNVDRQLPTRCRLRMIKRPMFLNVSHIYE